MPRPSSRSIGGVRPLIAFTATAVAGLCVLAISCGAARDSGGHTVPAPRAHRFDAARAWRLVTLQVGFGPRPAGLPEDDPDFERHGLRGSRAYVAAHRGRTAAMILLDYVGNRGLRLPREGTSDQALWRRMRAAAAAVGEQQVFPDRTETAITDD